MSEIKRCEFTVKPVENCHSHKTKIGFEDQLSLNAGQQYCKVLQVEHSATLSTFTKLPFVIKTIVLSILFLSGCFTEVLLYFNKYFKGNFIKI